MGRGDHNRHSDNYIGKVRANFVGTEFQVYDSGSNPKDDYGGDAYRTRQELGIVMYASNVLGSRGPRKMQVAINKVDPESNKVVVWAPETKDDEMLQAFKCKTEVSERSERALRKTSILAMDLTKLLQTATTTTKLNQLKIAPRFARCRLE